MGLFKKKKDKSDMSFSKRSSEDIRPPSFPGSQKFELPSFPTYEPTMTDHSEIKNEVSREDYDDYEEERPIMQEDKAIFVKINKYKAAMDTLEVIKEKLKTAEIIIDELSKIREKEEAEFNEWQNSIQEIKNKLSQVDRNLFEV